jgi:NACalpha-BTF3-like transcription factor
VDNLSKDGYIDNRRELTEERKDKVIDIVYKDKVNNNDKVINISFDKVLTIVLSFNDARARLSEDDIGMLERLSNAGVTESELRQALRDHEGKTTAALCREVLLAR